MDAPIEQDLRHTPVDNRPGHHPAVEQDKPTGPPPGPPRTGSFAFAFDGLFLLAGLPFGIAPATTGVEVTGDEVRIRFGLWRMTFDRAAVTSVEATGPYRYPKVLGPPRLSLRDDGITFATNAHRGVCIRLREPVPAIEPTRHVRHSGLTVTVDDVDGLVELLGR